MPGNKPPVRPKLDALILITSQILEEDKARIKKQRHTAKRIHARLRDEHGFTGCFTIITDYVCEKKMRSEVFFAVGPCAQCTAKLPGVFSLRFDHKRNGNR